MKFISKLTDNTLKIVSSREILLNLILKKRISSAVVKTADKF